MKEDQVHFYDYSFYEFRLYYGPTIKGLLGEEDGKYYIAENGIRPMGKKWSEFAIPVNLGNILPEPRALSQDEIKNLHVRNGTLMPMPQRKAKKMIIIGAGASYDYTYENVDDELRPPLTKDLFDDRYYDMLELYPGAESLSAELIRATDIEMHFQKLWHSIKEHYDPILLSKIINTQFYLRNLFESETNRFKTNRKSNYWRLVHHINEYLKKHEDEIVTIVSFNYDTLLEEALTRNLKYQFTMLDDYIRFSDEKRIMIFKPHGSWNWARFFKPNIEYSSKYYTHLSKYLYEKDYSMSDILEMLEDNIHIPREDEVGPRAPHFRSFFPWLLIPYRDKDEFTMPSKHETMLRHVLKDVNEIFIIGWKGSEDHFLNLLKNTIGKTQPKIVYCNKDDSSIEEYFKKKYVFEKPTQWVKFAPGHALPTFTNVMDYYSTTNNNLFS